MSRRFGRNQKRKLREAITVAEQQIQLVRHLRGNAERELAEANAQLEAVRYSLGKNFAALKPEIREVDRLDLQPVYNLWLKEPYMPFAPSGMLDITSAVQQQVALQVLLDHEPFVDKLRNQVHIRFTFGDEPVGYGISRFALMDQDRRWLEQTIATEIARVLVRNPKWRV
ncbi:MAG TPA: hypothetical protein VN794_18705 [Methylomirabilota bacterium]|nr:hypothetical protein [Methylomirabilota bacterium]